MHPVVFSVPLAAIAFALFKRHYSPSPYLRSPMATILPTQRSDWNAALNALPSTPEHIPSFFFGHGSPMLAMPDKSGGGFMNKVLEYAGPKGPLATFLQDFGPVLIEKYKPKGIVVFSAHWETYGTRLGI